MVMVLWIRRRSLVSEFQNAVKNFPKSELDKLSLFLFALLEKTMRIYIYINTFFSTLE